MTRFWILIALVFAALGYLLLRPSQEPAKPLPPMDTPIATSDPAASPSVTPAIPVRQSVSVPASAPLKVQPADAPPASALSSSIPVRYTTPPKNMVVDFRIQEGRAVAYGDVVLGDPPKGFHDPGGLAEVPRPKLWSRGEIPYLIQQDVVRPERIQSAIALFHQRTGVKFVPYDHQPDAIVFSKTKENCSSFLGRQGGFQPIYLSERCDVTNIAHELMHALGFVHEQSRTDRDQYVTILWPNIQEEFRSQFEMVPEPMMEVYGGSPFDPASILMYDPHSFAVNEQAKTMELKNGNEIRRAPGGLSDADVERVNRLYGD